MAIEIVVIVRDGELESVRSNFSGVNVRVIEKSKGLFEEEVMPDKELEIKYLYKKY